MIYQFGNFEVDTLNYQLRENGSSVDLEPKAFDLLAYLIAGRQQPSPATSCSKTSGPARSSPTRR